MKNLDQLRELLDNLELQVQKCKILLDGGSVDDDFDLDYLKKASGLKAKKIGEERVVEGVFDGQRMIGPDGKQYSVPANYISKSKLVEGDILKLVIDGEGNFVYKQIGPVERERKVGAIIKDESNGEFKVLAEGIFYKVVLASLTYYKGEEGDQAVLLVPKGVVSQWAAVENVIKK